MKLKIYTAGTAGGADRSTAALEFEDGATVFFLDGSPVAYTNDGELRLSAAVTRATFAAAFPVSADFAAKAVAVPERELEAVLLFRDRAFNRMLHEAFARMPFGAAAGFDLTPAGRLDFGQIASNVEALRERLKEHVAADEARDAELRGFRQAVAGVGLLLKLAGVIPPEPVNFAAEAEEARMKEEGKLQD